MPDTRFSSLQVDIVGPLPPSRSHKYLLSIIDRTSRWVEALPLTEATAEQCCNAFIHGWAQRFGLPTQLRSDNGNTFVATLWRNVHKAMGIDVAYTPPYHPASLGHIERQHKDIKVGLKTALYAMGDKHGENWLSHLPWVLLARRTALQPDLGTSPAEMTLGMHPRLPPDLLGEPGQPLSSPESEKLLEGLRAKAARPAVQPSHHGDKPVNLPNLDHVTHVFIKRGKTTPLGPSYDSPFAITERVGKSCIQVRVGSFASGEPRFELHHWQNCKPAHTDEGTPTATKC